MSDKLTDSDLGMLEEACWQTVELLDSKLEEGSLYYDQEDIDSMRRESDSYVDLANRLNLMRNPHDL